MNGDRMNKFKPLRFIANTSLVRLFSYVHNEILEEINDVYLFFIH